MNQTHNEQQNDQQSIQYRPHIHKRPHPQRQTNVCGRLLRALNIHRLYESDLLVYRYFQKYKDNKADFLMQVSYWSISIYRRFRSFELIRRFRRVNKLDLNFRGVEIDQSGTRNLSQR